MNIDEELVTRSLAALGEEAVDDPDVERHLAKFEAAFGRLAEDPAEAARIDMIAADAGIDLLASAPTAPRRTSVDVGDLERVLNSSVEFQKSTVRALELQEQMLAAMQTRDEAHRQSGASSKTARRPRWGSVLHSFTSVIMVVMVIGSILLGIFGSGSEFSTIATGLFALAPALHVLMNSWAILLFARHLNRAGPYEAERGLRLLLGSLSIELSAEEGRQAVAAAAVRHATSDQAITVVLQENHVQITKDRTSRPSP